MGNSLQIVVDYLPGIKLENLLKWQKQKRKEREL